MKIHIHPKYIHLKEAIAKIPEGGYEPLRTFCNSRNIVEQINIGDCAFVVKSYKVPNFANRIILFLQTKQGAPCLRQCSAHIEMWSEHPLSSSIY